MLKKRLIGVITVKNGYAVQSFGYNKYLPLGDPCVLVENLDRWGVDEIILQCIDRSSNKLGPDLALLERISSEGRATPLVYSGGINSEKSAVSAIQAGADRVCIDSLLHDSPQSIEGISNRLGAQALIASLPVSYDTEGFKWLDYRTGKLKDLDGQVVELLQNKIISEAFVIDWKNEGYKSQFDMQLLSKFPFINIPLIAFGGLSEPEQLKEALLLPNVTAVAIGNFLAYSEHAVQSYKTQLSGIPMRDAFYGCDGADK
ncbi:MAG: HisA/HisF-related TIM barrel protein [Colwellia sp.]